MGAYPSAKIAFAFVAAFLAGGGAMAQEATIAGPPPPPPGTGYVPPPECATRSDLLGLSRIVEIDTTGGPRYGEQHKSQEFLNDGEVVLTFDDGPIRRYTQPILDALDEQCTKATFFSVGRMAIADPAILKEVARRGHTIGVHTWSHKNLASLSAASAIYEIELGISAVSKALGAPVAPFFRYPYLAESRTSLSYLSSRHMGVFGIHVDSRDFRTRSPGAVLRTVLAQLERRRKGILLFHDIQPSTAGALSSLLAELKKRGYKVVHMVAKSPATTLPEYDAIAEKALNTKLAAQAGKLLRAKAATWPNESGAADGSGENLPWASTSKAPAAAVSKGGAPATGKTTRKIDWSNPDGDPWQLRPFGN